MTDRLAWWWHRQGLDGTLAGADPATVLASTGWARSGGGASPYLTLFARSGLARSDVDSAVAALAIHELPAARGCTYVVPAEDFGLALQVGRGAPEAEVATVAKLGVYRAEIDTLCAAVLDALATGPLDPAALRAALGPAVRNLGEAGRRKGVSTTLPVALGLLQAAGSIRRVPLSNRLDQQRFAYTRWGSLSSGRTDEEARVELARRYLGWTGGASPAHLRWFTGFSARDAKAALAPLDPVPLTGELLALPADAKAFANFTPPKRPHYAMIASLDALILLRRDLPSLLAPADLALEIPGTGKALGAHADLPDHAIIDRGRLVGLWQYDVDGQRIAWWTFDPAIATVRALRSEVDRTEAYLREQLGDARSMSLDSPKSRAPRIDALDQARSV
ncbi:MAG: DNA glycosylase AlkZ-like family protein [Labedaea sp.]